MGTPLGMLDVTVTFLKSQLEGKLCKNCQEKVSTILNDLENTLDERKVKFFQKAFFESE